MSDRAKTLARVLRLEPGRTALLVVDMQHGFVDPGEALEVPPAREIVPAIGALVEGFRARRLPVRPSTSWGGPSAVSYHRRKSSTPSPAGKESHDA